MIIAFEGHNGVGKSTVAKLVASKINAKYMYGVDRDSLENGLKEKFIMNAYWYSSALHFLAGCMETKRKIENEYKEDLFVLDRSFWSTLAVQWNRKEEDKKRILNIIRDGAEFLPIPNYIFILTAEYETCNNRILSKNNNNEIALDSVVNEEYYNKEINFYNWLKNNKHITSSIITVYTDNKSINEIVDECLKYLKVKEINYNF